MAGQIFTADMYDASTTIEADVCIIGSGAGGSVTAATFAKAGARVALLEAGGYYQRKDFNMSEADMMPKLYQERGNRGTDDLSMIILQGRSVGGSTTVNWTTSFRTPEHILAAWERTYGVEGFSKADLDPAWDRVEQRLHIGPIALEEINANNRVLWDGAKTLGYEPQLLNRNVKTCMKTGYCGMGCPVNAKQAMHLTYIPDAVNAGANVYANVRVQKLIAEGGRITRVEAAVMDESRYEPSAKRFEVRAGKVIVCGGAINTPMLLLRSKLADPHGLVGKRTFFHPVVFTIAEFEDPIEGFYGAPQAVAVHDKIDQPKPGQMGYFLETAPVHPLVAAMSTNEVGTLHRNNMTRLAHLNSLIALHIDGVRPDERGGTVSINDKGKLSLTYDYPETFWKTARESTKLMMRIQLAAGALRTATAHIPHFQVDNEKDVDKVDDLPFEPLKIVVFSAHVMGGAPMGGRPETSVVDSSLKHRQYDNLWVIDGSVFPSSVGVNPSETIYGMSLLTAERLSKRG